MNQRERILTSINHRDPDKVPIDLGSTPSSGISAIAYNNLKKHLSMKGGHSRIYDVVQQVVQPEDDIINLFNIDVLDVGRTFNTHDCDWHKVTVSDGSTAEYPSWFKPCLDPKSGYLAYDQKGNMVGRMPEGATFFDQTVFPYQDGYPDTFESLPQAMSKVVWAALPHSPWDHSSESDFWERLRENALKLKKESNHAIMIVCGCNLFEWGTFLRRIDNFLMDLYLEPKKVESLLDALLELHLNTLEKVCAAVGDVADIIRFGDDLGMDNGPFMAPEIYREFFKPRHQMLCEYVKKRSSMKTFLHSCGSLYKLIPDLIEAGYDILNPIQTSCRDMEPEKLKKEFGKDITFWGGGCDTRHILNHGTPLQVAEHAKNRLDILLKDGGFVFAAEHNIMPDVPPENIIAMYKTIQSFT